MRPLQLMLLVLLLSLGCGTSAEQRPVANITTMGESGMSSDESPPITDLSEPEVRGDATIPGNFNQLTDVESYVLLEKGTERAWTGEYTELDDEGTFICRRCNSPLYRSDAKFDSHCGWPSFDAEIPGGVQRNVDRDGYRIEIVCRNCGGHLGHVFMGEGFTETNTRHCVNSVSMRFVAAGESLPAVIPPAKQE